MQNALSKRPELDKALADCLARERRRPMALRTAATGSRMSEMLASGFGRGDKKAAAAPARGSNLQKLHCCSHFAAQSSLTLGRYAAGTGKLFAVVKTRPLNLKTHRLKCNQTSQ